MASIESQFGYCPLVWTFHSRTLNNRINNFGYHLRKAKLWETSNIRTAQWGSDTLSFRGPRTWNLVPKQIKEFPSINEFKAKIKHWKPMGCTCKLCKIFIPEVGYI